MGRAVLTACAPWLGWLMVSFVVLFLLLRACRAKMDIRRLQQLHADQHGTAQSLSFVLALPFFVIIILFIVQVSQLMIATVVVQYAAVAAARAAAVWIPAECNIEKANCISRYDFDWGAKDQVAPVPDGPTAGGQTFLVEPGSPKYDKICSAAVMACMPISPSRDVGLSLSGQGPAAAAIVKTAYAALAPGASSNAAVPRRIENKLAYAMANTSIELRFYHPNSEPLNNWQLMHYGVPLGVRPLGGAYNIPDHSEEFQPNELGWQDQITVKVNYSLALLPGPGRLLAGTGVQHIQGNVYTYPLSASATIGNEGEKSMFPYGN